MSKLILVKNVLEPEDRVVFVGEAEDLSTLTGMFLSANPRYFNLMRTTSFSVRINNIKLILGVNAVNTRILPEDEVLFYPDLEEGFTWAAFFASVQAGAASAAGTGAALSGVAAMGGVATLVSYGVGYGAVMLGGIALMSGVSMGLNALFAPSMTTPGGPSENSPSYGWNLSPTSKEGIAIPVVYGEHLVGGNVISSAKEYIVQQPWEWRDAGDKHIKLTELIPATNLFLIGLNQPCRGVEFKCKLDTPYLFFSLRIFTKGSWDLFWSEFFNKLGENIQIDTHEKFQEVQNTVAKAFGNIFLEAKTQMQIDFDALINNPTIIMDENTVRSVTEKNIKLTRSLIRSDFKFILATIDDGIRAAIEAAIYAAYIVVKDTIGTFTYKYHEPVQDGDTYAEIFMSDALDEDNMGCYLVGGVYLNTLGLGVDIVFNPWEFVDIIFWLDTSWTGMTQKQIVDALNVIGVPVDGHFDLTQLYEWNKVKLQYRMEVSKVLEPKYSTEQEFLSFLKKRDKYEEDIRHDQVLHQLIALGEGECSGIKELYVNDSPSKSVPSLSYKFFKGGNEQNLGAGGGAVAYDNFNHATIYHSEDTKLNRSGDYVEFTSTKNFDVSNVIIETESVIYTVSSSGHIRPISRGREPFKFSIQIGFDWSTFDGWNILEGITQAILNNGMFLHYTYELRGQFDTLPTISRFAALPIRDFLISETDWDIIALRFPGMMLGLCAWLAITPWDDIYDHQRYLDEVTYHDEVLTLIKEKIITYFLEQKNRMRVRVTRISDRWDGKGEREITVKAFQEISYKGFNYPNTALLGIEFLATAKHSAVVPKITSILKGKKILVPELLLKQDILPDTPVRVYHEFAWYDEDSKCYRSNFHNGGKCFFNTTSEGNLVWVEEWSNNPVWCLYDLLTNRRYGLGEYVSQYNIPLDWFLDASKHCDTLVPDGTVRFADSITETTLSDQDSDFFKNGNNYFDENVVGQSKQGSGSYGSDITDSIEDTLELGYEKVVAGSAIFAKKEDGTWTRAVVRNIIRTPPVIRVLAAKADLTFSRDFSQLKDSGSPFWTNGLPCNNASSANYNRYELSEKRFILDLVLDNTATAIDWVKTICDSFRAFPMYIGGGYTPVIDKIKDPIATIGMGNIVKDSMQLSYVPLAKTYNIVEAQFMNRENEHKRDTRQVVDADVDVASASVVHNAIRKKTVKMFGITRPSQVMRDMTYQLLNSKYNKKLITFSMGTEHINMTAGDVFIFNHVVILGDSVSGRIQGYVSDGGEKVILDQDVSSLVEPLVLSIKQTVSEGYCYKCSKWIKNVNEEIDLTATVCPTCRYPINGEEIVSDYTVSSVSGNEVFATFGVIKPKSFDTYELGQATETKQYYRVVSIQPGENGLANIVGTEYNESVYGTPRSIVGGGTTAYEDVEVATQDNRISILQTAEFARPLSNLIVFPTNINAREIKVLFSPPEGLNPFYMGARIRISSVEEGEIHKEDVLDFKSEANFVVFSKSYTYTVQASALYVGDVESDALQNTFSLDTIDFTTIAYDPHPPQVVNLRLAPRCRPLDYIWNSEYNEFTTNFIELHWDHVGMPDDDDKWWNNKLVEIEGYHLTLEVLDASDAVLGTEYFTLNKYENFKNIAIQDLLPITEDNMPPAYSEAFAKIKKVRATVVAFIECGYESEIPTVEVFEPHRPLTPNTVTSFTILDTVYTWWFKMDDSENVDRYSIEIDMVEGTYNNEDYRIIWSSGAFETKETYSIFKIPKKAWEIDGFNLLGWVFGQYKFTPRITAISKFNVPSSTRTYTEDGTPVYDETNPPPDTGTTPDKIPDYMLASPVSQITVYDLRGFYHWRPTVREHRDLSQSDYLTIQNIIDGYDSTGVGYTNISWTPWKKVVRITYESPIEEEYGRVAFNVDRPCRAWIEYINTGDYGNYEEGDWEYLGGNTGNNLNSGALIHYGTKGLAEDCYWEVEAGENLATFPEPVKNRYMRLILSPIDDSAVIVNELRFVRVGTFEELSVDLIKNLDWDEGDEKFYLDANATGLVDDGPSDPVFWTADGGVGGTREYPNVRLDSSGFSAQDSDGYRVTYDGDVMDPEGVTHPSGGVDWSLIDEYYLSKWTTTVEFESADYKTMSWTEGELNFIDGETFEIVTDVIELPTGESAYVYFAKDLSITELQVTHEFTELATVGRVLIARGIRNTDEDQKASIIGSSVVRPLITETEIGDNSIKTGHLTTNCVEAGQIDADAVTATEINVGTLEAISANCGTLNAGVIQNTAWGTAPTATNNKLQFNLATGVITVNLAGGLAIGGTGSLTLATGGNLDFSGVCVLDADSGADYMYFHPEDDETQIFVLGGSLGTETKVWKIVNIESKECRIFMDDSGDGLKLLSDYIIELTTQVGDINIEGGDDVNIRSDDGVILLDANFDLNQASGGDIILKTRNDTVGGTAGDNGIHLYLPTLTTGKNKTKYRLYTDGWGNVKCV